jgi:hypothetical protein
MIRREAREDQTTSIDAFPFHALESSATPTIFRQIVAGALQRVAT